MEQVEQTRKTQSAQRFSVPPLKSAGWNKVEQSEMETAKSAAQPEPPGEMLDPQTPWDVYVATACAGKVAYGSAREAYDQYQREKKRARRPKGKARRPDRQRAAYRCKVCGKWHMGYLLKGAKAKRRGR